jgi:hypothetical protein
LIGRERCAARPLMLVDSLGAQARTKRAFRLENNFATAMPGRTDYPGNTV